jgi:hypothetical protein
VRDFGGARRYTTPRYATPKGQSMSVPSLHLVVLRELAGDRADYEPFRAAVRQHAPGCEISAQAWYIVSSDSDNEIKHKLTQALPPVAAHSQAHGQMTAGALKFFGGRITHTSKSVPDPLADRLVVVRVYHPANAASSNPDMKDIFERLTGEEAGAG